MNYDRDFDYLDSGDDSDPEKAESSEDEIDILLHGTPEQKRKLCHRKKGEKSSSEDEFEKEMNAELDIKVEALEARRSSVTADIPSGEGTSAEAATGTNREESRYYDDVYFDSDEEDMVKEGDARAKRKQVSNDELLYDPDLDDDDQRWVDSRRQKCVPKGKQRESKGKIKPLPNSDAVLNCPACMSTLCLDCQRHDLYKNQYRAMFVSNCSVDKKEFLKYPKPEVKSKRKKKQKSLVDEPGQTSNDADDKFNPVKCTECGTVVAVYDADEVYHFFNVLSSYG